MADEQKKVEKKRKVIEKKANRTVHASPDTSGKPVACHVKSAVKKAVALILAALFAGFAGVAVAGMDGYPMSVTVVATGTNSTSRVLRGELEGIYIDVAAGSTQTVTLATSQQTLYTKAGITADVWVPLRYALYGSTGSALTFVGGTNNTANAWYGKAPLAGLVTLTVVGQCATTNTTTVTPVVKQ